MPERETEGQNDPLEGLFKGFSAFAYRSGFSCSGAAFDNPTITLKSGKSVDLLIFGGWGEGPYPEIIAITSKDGSIRMIAKAQWENGQPIVEGADTISGRVALTGFASEISGNTFKLKDPKTTSQELETGELDEIIDLLGSRYEQPEESL